MRDVKIIIPSDDTQLWNLDIDIIDGFPTLLEEASMTNDQRAAVSAVMEKGTVPGSLDTGVDWTALYSGNNVDVEIVNIDNEIKQQIQANVPIIGGVSQQYIPIYLQTDKGIEFIIEKAG